jgi:4-amino-4-deoxy-L-arabinose transferase-like glycosyltransferase
MRKLGVLLALGLLPLLGLGALGLVDYDEAAYGEVARAMLARADWLVPTLCGEPWFEKPPLLYWTAALGMKLLGVGPAGVRLGTALAGAAAPIALYGFSRRPLGERAAFCAALVLAAGLEFAVLARIAFTDMLLLLCFTVCLGALHRAFEAREGALRWLALACLASGLAMLAKGAIGALFPGAVALGELVLRGRWRDAFRPSWLALALVIVGGVGSSWYLALGLTQPGGFGFMRALFIENHVGRFSEPMQGHGGSFLYYVPVLVVGLLPWSALLPLAIARAGLRAGDERARYLRLFALFSGLVFVFFSIAATKLANYVAPALPGCALLIGACVARPADAAGDRALGRSFAVTLAVVALLAITFALFPVAARYSGLLAADEKVALHPALDHPLEPGPGAPLAGLLLAAGGMAAWVAWGRERREQAVLALAVGSLASFTALFVLVGPRIDAQIGAPLRRIAVRAAELTAPDEKILLLGLRHRPSVCFSGARPTTFVSEMGGKWAEAGVFGPGHPRIGISGIPQLSRFPGTERLEEIGRDGGYVLFRIPETASDGAR